MPRKDKKIFTMEVNEEFMQAIEKAAQSLQLSKSSFVRLAAMEKIKAI
ncbi:MAG: hypothetical protein V1837_05025 [Candidatus Woesearchaeota archaeon]